MTLDQAPAPAPAPAPTTPGNGLATAGFVLGLVGFLGSFIPVLNVVGIILGVIGVVLAVLGLLKVKNGAGGKGMALAGTILGGLAIIIGIVVNVTFASAVDDALDDLSTSSAPQTSGDDTQADDVADTDSTATDDQADDAAATDPLTTLFPVFDPVEFSGTGGDVITLPATAGIITWDNPDLADNWFNLTVLDADNAPTVDVDMVWGHGRGTTNGVFLYGAGWASADDATSLQIEATGSWTVTISPISTAAPLPEAGAGDGVFQVDTTSGTWTITSEHDSGNFSVEQIIPGTGLLGTDGGLLVFENNPYSGRVPVKAGLSLIHISADGASWTIARD